MTPPYKTEKNHLKEFFRYIGILSAKPHLVFFRHPAPADFTLIFAYFASLPKPVRPQTARGYYNVFRKQLANFDIFLPLIDKHQGLVDRYDGYTANFFLPTKITSNIIVEDFADVIFDTNLRILDDLKKACGATTSFFTLVRAGNVADPRPLKIMRFSHIIFFPSVIAPKACLIFFPGLKNKPAGSLAYCVANGTKCCVCGLWAQLYRRCFRGDLNEPMLTLSDGKTELHWSHITSFLQDGMSKKGLNGALYGVKSLRKGGLAYAASKGFDEFFCRALGQWNSNAIDIYRQTQIHQLERFAKLSGADISRHRKL